MAISDKQFEMLKNDVSALRDSWVKTHPTGGLAIRHWSDCYSLNCCHLRWGLTAHWKDTPMTKFR